MLCLSVIGTVLSLIRHGDSNFTDPDCLQDVMTKSSFGIYILHYPILIITCYTLHYCTNFSAIWKYIIALVVELIMTFTINELVKRVPVLRYFVLDMKREIIKN